VRASPLNNDGGEERFLNTAIRNEIPDRGLDSFDRHIGLGRHQQTAGTAIRLAGYVDPWGDFETSPKEVLDDSCICRSAHAASGATEVMDLVSLEQRVFICIFIRIIIS